MEMLEWALAYIERGWFVFPVHGIAEDGACTCGAAHDAPGDRDAGKHPVLRNGVKGATVDPKKAEGWWGAAEGARWNVGIRTGEVSGMTVLDVDVGEGKLGGETWAALVSEKGEPDTLMATTGSGGAHVFFAYNSALNTSSNTLGPGVDCRNDGGYVVAAPSRHRSGGTYRWVAWDPSTRLAALPAHLSKRVETRGRKKGDAHRSRKYTIEQVRGMLEHVSTDDRDLWRAVGIVLGREFVRADEAWELYQAWSATWGGPKGRGHDEIMRGAFYDISQQPPSGNELTMGTVIGKAVEGGWVPDAGDVERDNFIYYGPGNNYLYVITSTFWLADAVNAAVGLTKDEAGNLLKASVWIQKNRLATSMTRSPSVEEVFTKGFDSRDGEMFPSRGGAVVNTYRGPSIELGDARLAGPFLAHVAKVFPREGDAEQFLNYMAHRVQHPGTKPRFALLIAGEMGTGKDTAIDFCIPAIGHWNMSNIEPHVLDSHFNDYASSTLIRISEAANLQDMSKWAFNERLKVLIAGRPDLITINPKYGQQYDINMYCGVIVTTNHLATGIYIPPGDRRYDVIEAATKAEMGLSSAMDRAEYFGEIWDWFSGGGDAHVAAFLFEREVGRWSAATGQRETEAHKSVVSAGMGTEHWLLDAMAELKDPDVVRVDVVIAAAEKDGGLSRREIQARLAASMTRIGYYAVRCPFNADGRWRFENDKRSVVYARNSMNYGDVAKLISTLKERF